MNEVSSLCKRQVNFYFMQQKNIKKNKGERDRDRAQTKNKQYLN